MSPKKLLQTQETTPPVPISGTPSNPSNETRQVMRHPTKNPKKTQNISNRAWVSPRGPTKNPKKSKENIAAPWVSPFARHPPSLRGRSSAGPAARRFGPAASHRTARFRPSVSPLVAGSGRLVVFVSFFSGSGQFLFEAASCCLDWLTSRGHKK